MATDFQTFIAEVDETMVNAISITRKRDAAQQLEGSAALVVASEPSFDQGSIIVAIGTAAATLDHVAITLHGFVDGARVPLDPLVINGEVMVTMHHD